MTHHNYHEIQGDSNYQLGLEQGRLFKEPIDKLIRWLKKQGSLKKLQMRAEPYLKASMEHFPHLVEELKGVAEGAQVNFNDLWIGQVEELFENNKEKCTTVITNNGTLIGHNEDWEDPKSLCLLRKQLKDLVIFEIHYYGGLGGNAVSINSHGMVHAVNTVFHWDQKIGVPKNIIARVLSETADPISDVKKLESIPRASGYCHTLVDMKARILNLECTAGTQAVTEPIAPFCHANHYLCKDFENPKKSDSFSRYDHARSRVQPNMSLEGLKGLMRDGSRGKSKSIFNSNTLAQCIVDLEKKKIHVWLAREKDKGWITYPLYLLISRQITS